jgi:hypothetical protein
MCLVHVCVWTEGVCTQELWPATACGWDQAAWTLDPLAAAFTCVQTSQFWVACL